MAPDGAVPCRAEGVKNVKKVLDSGLRFYDGSDVKL